MSYSCCTKHYSPKRIFECCSDSNCIEVEVKPGQVGEIRIIDAPEGLIFCIEEVIWDSCCKNKTIVCVPDENDDDNPMALTCGQTACDLCAGTYKISIYDCDGNEVAPDSGEVIAMFSQKPER